MGILGNTCFWGMPNNVILALLHYVRVHNSGYLGHFDPWVWRGSQLWRLMGPKGQFKNLQNSYATRNKIPR